MKTIFTITTNWFDVPLNFKHRGELEEEAKRRSLEMIQDGYTAGELNCLVGNRDYSGWWELNIKND